MDPSLCVARATNRQFIDNLLHPNRIQMYNLPIPIQADLRGYQQVSYCATFTFQPGTAREHHPCLVSWDSFYMIHHFMADLTLGLFEHCLFMFLYYVIRKWRMSLERDSFLLGVRPQRRTNARRRTKSSRYPDLVIITVVPVTCMSRWTTTWETNQTCILNKQPSSTNQNQRKLMMIEHSRKRSS